MKLSVQHNLRAAVIGKDGRTSAICRLLEQSPRIAGPVHSLGTGKSMQRGLVELLAEAQRVQPDFVVIGPEEPLAAGIVDKLSGLGIPCVGPTEKLARLESSKSFTRQLLQEFRIPGNPRHRVFSNESGLRGYLEDLGEYVIKPDGLTGGKGVKVSGDHLHSIADGLDYCRELLGKEPYKIVVEEKLDGEEFSLQSFCDGSDIRHSVPVQDHKRAHNGDQGPNTGGMGSYTDANHLLPFLTAGELAQAEQINEAVFRAAQKKCGEPYKGILFGGFMVTREGVRLLEYNVRFGDPEALNVLSLLETDFAEVCVGMIDQTLNKTDISFRHEATVCKYIVPNRYPEAPVSGQLDVSKLPVQSDRVKYYEAAVEARADGNYNLMGSRALAIVGIGKTITDAADVSEAAAALVAGPVFHRTDIGTPALISKRVKHMEGLRHRVAV